MVFYSKKAFTLKITRTSFRGLLLLIYPKFDRSRFPHVITLSYITLYIFLYYSYYTYCVRQLLFRRTSGVWSGDDLSPILLIGRLS